MTIKDPECLSRKSNAKLGQSGRHQSGSQEVPGSISTVGNIFAEFCSSLPKSLLSTLPAVYN